MASAIHHSISSSRKFGGDPEKYLPIHEWFDSSKTVVPDIRHRALHHHQSGVVMAERIFGRMIENGAGRMIPVRWIAEQHINEDLGFVPNAADWLRKLELEPWMSRGRKLSQELEEEERQKHRMEAWESGLKYAFTEEEKA